MAKTDEPYSQNVSDRGKELLNQSFVNEQHIESFREALALNDLIPDPITPNPNSNSNPSNPSHSNTPRQTLSPTPSTLSIPSFPSQSHTRRPSQASQSSAISQGWEKVESIKSLSDFAPVHQRVRGGARGSRAGGRGRAGNSGEGGVGGWGFKLFRFPLLGLIFLVIYLEFGMYVFLRQIVTGFEWVVASINRPAKRRLMRALKSAKGYEEWCESATALDKTLGFQEWKETDEDPKYDYPLIRKVRKSLISLRTSGDARALMGVLEICLRNNFAGVEGVRMYSETFLGTKGLIESYVNEVKRSLDFVSGSNNTTLEEKRRFYRAINKNYGASALCLSGGAGFGYYHFGVVKAFLEADLLPRVVTGTSAGGLVAALTCTRTDEELREMLVPELADRITACEDGMLTWMKRVYRTGARFDSVKWAEKATFFTRGSMTFREAYERTGRALNVSVIPHDQHSPTKLLNYLTAPDCVIWSAIIASAAVPGILNGVVLMQKTKDGDLRPMNFGSKFKDGSLRVDIPLESLHLLFNVNYAIVSQANPHVHLFFFAPRGSVGSPVAHRKGKGWRGGFLLSAAEQYLKLELTKNFKVIRDLELMPQLLGSDWSSVFLQRFAGSVTILPKSRLTDWFKLLRDPDRKELGRMLRVGQQVAWPTLHMIENRLKIERSVLHGRASTRQALHRAHRSDRRPGNNDHTPASSSAAPSRPSSTNPHDRDGRFLPLESDAERAIAARSAFRKKQHSSGGSGGTGVKQSPLRRGGTPTPPNGSVAGSSGGFGGGPSAWDQNLRRRRGKTTSPSLENTPSSLSKSRQRKLDELLSSNSSTTATARPGTESPEDRMNEIADQEEEPPARLPVRASSVPNSPQQERRRSFAGFTGFPTFGRGKGKVVQQNVGVIAEGGDGEEAEEGSTLGVNINNPTGSGSRFARWLSPSAQSGTSKQQAQPTNTNNQYLDMDSSSEDEDEGLELDIEALGREVEERDVYGGGSGGGGDDSVGEGTSEDFGGSGSGSADEREIGVDGERVRQSDIDRAEAAGDSI